MNVTITLTARAGRYVVKYNGARMSFSKMPQALEAIKVLRTMFYKEGLR